MPIRVLHVGLGPIGAGIVRQVARRAGLVIAGGVDVDPALAGRDLGDLAGIRRKLAVKVSGDLAAALETVRPDVAIVSTTSSLAEALPTFERILKHRVPIVSTTEELAYPFRAHGTLARRLDKLAKRSRVAVLGTGVNPGFVMDALPIALSSMCTDVTAVEVVRVQDARLRRAPFQRKIGAGLSADAFGAQVRAGAIGHRGMAESIGMLADAMGWKLDRITDDIKPRLAEETVTGTGISVAPGEVCGLVQDGVGWRKGRALVSLHFEAYLGAPEAHDEIRISGTPPLVVRVAGGVPGDVATAAAVANVLPAIMRAEPGLRTMRDMLLPSFDGASRR